MASYIWAVMSASLPRRRSTSTWVPDLVGDAGGEAADARQLLDPHHVAVHVQQLVGHRAVAAREIGELARLVLGVRRVTARRERVGFGGELLQRPHDESVNHVPAEQHEHDRVADPEPHEGPEELVDVAADQHQRGEPDQEHRRRGDEAEADEQLGAERPAGRRHVGSAAAGGRAQVHLGSPATTAGASAAMLP
jgi:hypothetical protein